MAKQQQKKARQDDPTRSKPLSLDALKEYGALEGFSAPEGDFDPAGAWTHLYRFWLVGNSWHQYRGFFEIKRGATSGDGTFDLEYSRSMLLSQHPAFHDTTVRMKCACDALATPRSWELEAETFDIQRKPFDLSRVEESASVSDGKIRGKRNNRDFERSVPTPFTSDFSLLDAIQRLPKAETKPLEFALLQDMDELKEGQTLRYRERVDSEIGGKALALHCYEQIGRGLLPYRYYVDEQGRLLFAISGVRAYIYDPSVRERQKKAVEWLIVREERKKK